MDVKHVNPFLESTLDVFESLLGEVPQAGAPSLMGNFHTHRWDISGIIGIVGAADGIIALRLTLGFVSKILENSGVVCDDEAEHNDVVNSMVGEIINMIAGNSVGKIDQYDLSVTVPLVVQGENHSIAWPRNTPIITVPFHMSKGVFEVNFSLKENKLYKETIT